MKISRRRKKETRASEPGPGCGNGPLITRTSRTSRARFQMLWLSFFFHF